MASPALLGHVLIGVDAQELSTVKDLSVRDPVPPMGMEEPVQAIEVKPVEFLDMPAVHSPCLAGIQKGLREQQPCTC